MNRLSLDTLLGTSLHSQDVPKKGRWRRSYYEWQEQNKGTHPAENAVGLVAELTVELVHFVLIDAPPSTVGCLAVEAAIRATFSDAQTHVQKALVLLFCEQLLPGRYSDHSEKEEKVKAAYWRWLTCYLDPKCPTFVIFFIKLRLKLSLLWSLGPEECHHMPRDKSLLHLGCSLFSLWDNPWARTQNQEERRRILQAYRESKHRFISKAAVPRRDSFTPAESVQTLSEHDALSWLQCGKADGTVDLVCVGNEVLLVRQQNVNVVLLSFKLLSLQEPKRETSVRMIKMFMTDLLQNFSLSLSGFSTASAT